MMVKHTPGPWYMAGVPAVLSRDGVGIADCRTVDTTPQEQEANARLIAAAPDLLAACKALLADLDARGEETCWCLPGDPGVGLRGTVCEACQMRAAVARAE